MKKILVLLGVTIASLVFVVSVASAQTATITVTNFGNGGGTVIGSTVATVPVVTINCGSGVVPAGPTCSTTNTAPTILVATPDRYSTFMGWSGGGCTGTKPCTVSGSAKVVASFSPKSYVNSVNGHTYYMTREMTWSDAERVGVSLGGHLVTVNNRDEALYIYNTFLGELHWIGLNDVNLNGVNNEGRFVWSSGQTSSFDVSKNSAEWQDGQPDGGINGVPDQDYVTAYYNALDPYSGWSDETSITTRHGLLEVEPTTSSPTLTVTKSGIGKGTVSGTPINCGSVCSSKVARGTTVTLVATPSQYSVFVGWSGGPCVVSGTGGNTCSVLMGADGTVTNVGASFNTTNGTIYVQRVDANMNYISNPMAFSSVTVDNKSTSETRATSTFPGLLAGPHNVSYTTFQTTYETYIASSTYGEGSPMTPVTTPFMRVYPRALIAYQIPTPVVAGYVTNVVIKSVINSGSIIISRVDSNGSVIPATTHIIGAYIDSGSANPSNPVVYSGLTPSSATVTHAAYSADLPNYNESYATCSYLQNSQSPDCSVPITSYSTSGMTCSRGYCAVVIPLNSNYVTKIFYKYDPIVIVPTNNTYTLTVSPNTLDPGQTVIVNWTASALHSPNDWVAVFTTTAANTAYYPATGWKYVPAGSSGTLSFTAPTTPGAYQIRHILYNSSTIATTSNTFTVATPISTTLSVSPTTPSAGETVTVRFTAPDTHSPNDWVGLYSTTAADNSYLTWKYVPVGPSGYISFTAPTTVGTYQFRYILNGGSTASATSNNFTVAGRTQTSTVWDAFKRFFGF